MALQKTMQETECLSVDETAHELRVSRRTIENLIRLKELRAAKVGRRVLIKRSEMLAFLRRKSG